MQAEIDALPPECLHARQENGDWDVYVADALQIPNILIEIGRLREYTFRQVGEGSGNACDLDTYDNHYKHLFLWDRKYRKILYGMWKTGTGGTVDLFLWSRKYRKILCRMWKTESIRG